MARLRIFYGDQEQHQVEFKLDGDVLFGRYPDLTGLSAEWRERTTVTRDNAPVIRAIRRLLVEYAKGS